jgi:hypothetical protein
MNDEFRSPLSEIDNAGGQHAKRAGSGPASALAAGWPVAVGRRRPGGGQRTPGAAAASACIDPSASIEGTCAI